MGNRIETAPGEINPAGDSPVPLTGQEDREALAFKQMASLPPGPAAQIQSDRPDWWHDLPERERNQSPKDRTLGVLSNFLGLLPHLRAAELARERGEGSLFWNLVNTGTPRHEAERKALQQYYNRNYENAQDSVKVL